MKKIWLYIAILISSGVAGNVAAQSEVDALRISATHFGGTARFNGMAGAFGALGGDFSSISVNPGGLGVYRKSEFTFSPSLYGIGTTSTVYGQSASDSKLNFNFGNFGYAGTTQLRSSGGWQSAGFAIGYNRQSNFHSRVTTQAVNGATSLADTYRDDLQGIDPAFINESVDAFGTALAWETFLIDTVDGAYVSAVPNSNGQQQTNIVTSYGSVGETVFAFAGNYDNRLFIGGSIGVQNARYVEQMTHEETITVNTTDSVNSLKYFKVTDDLRTTGTGYNAKFGLIYRAGNFLRLGAAIHSPTAFLMSDRWKSRIDTEFEGGFSYVGNSPDGRNNYRLITPFKAVGSLALVLGKRGVVSADYEYIDYSKARLRSGGDGYSFSAENTRIQQAYRATGNVRVGGELKLNPFAIRAGYAFYGSPYNPKIDTKGSRDSYSLGFGYREDGVFVDLGYVLTRGSYYYYQYNPEYIRPARVSTVSSSIVTTLGFRF